MRYFYMTVEETNAIEEVMKTRNVSMATAIELLNKENEEKSKEATKIMRELAEFDPRTMSKQEIIQATWKLPPLPDELYQMISLNQGFKTGSGVISPRANPKDEDWCVMLPPSVFGEYYLGTIDEGYWEQDGFSSIYCHRDGKLINILCFSDVQLFNSWLATTEAMTKMMDWFTMQLPGSEINFGDIFNTKWKRVRIFRALRDITYEPTKKKSCPKDEALKYYKCTLCSREAINFTCKEARSHYNQTGICERCSQIEY